MSFEPRREVAGSSVTVGFVGEGRPGVVRVEAHERGPWAGNSSSGRQQQVVWFIKDDRSCAEGVV